MPESPRYLSLVNRNEEAWAIIKKIHHDPKDDEDTAARAEYIQIIKQVEADKETEGGYIAMFTKPSWRKRSLLALFLMFATQSTGCLGITTFQVIIYSSLGLKGPMPLLMYSVYVTVAAFFNFSGAASLDKIGRRRQLRKPYKVPRLLSPSNNLSSHWISSSLDSPLGQRLAPEDLCWYRQQRRKCGLRIIHLCFHLGLQLFY
jgi:hypothetical protein